MLILLLELSVTCQFCTHPSVNNIWAIMTIWRIGYQNCSVLYYLLLLRTTIQFVHGFLWDFLHLFLNLGQFTCIVMFVFFCASLYIFRVCFAGCELDWQCHWSPRLWSDLLYVEWDIKLRPFSHSSTAFSQRRQYLRVAVA